MNDNTPHIQYHPQWEASRNEEATEHCTDDVEEAEESHDRSMTEESVSEPWLSHSPEAPFTKKVCGLGPRVLQPLLWKKGSGFLKS